MDLTSSRHVFRSDDNRLGAIAYHIALTTWLDFNMQGKILRLMLKNVPFFAAFRLDKVLITFIEKQNSNESKSITFALAHEVLLRWTHQQPILDINEASATILLEVFEVIRPYNLTRSINILSLYKLITRKGIILPRDMCVKSFSGL